MNYQVPQFIEVEDKIFGQFTLKQFLYIAGGAGICVIVFRFIPIFFIAVIIAIIIMGFSLALAFVRYNDRPFINIVESAFKYLFSKKLYLWKKEITGTEKLSEKTDTGNINEDGSPKITLPKLSQSKLKDLSWSLDIQESIYSNKNQK